jgi:PAS domain S-box-containing protein
MSTINRSLFSEAPEVRIRDVTLCESDSDLVCRQKLARIILDGMFEFVGLLDVDGTIVESSRAALEGGGFGLDDIRGRLFWETNWWSASQESRDLARDLVQRARSGEFVRRDVEILGRDAGKGLVVVDCSLLPIRDEKGRVVFLLPEGRDITEKKRVEIELARKNDQLQQLVTKVQQAQAEAEHANRAKSDFLSSMSHELRSPLNAILGFAQLMASESPPPTSSQQVSIDQILRAGWHLLELINEVLDLAKIESGQVSMSPEPISLSDMLRECESMIGPQAQQRDIRLSFPNVEPLCHVHADRTRLKQILINLLSNAIKYNRPSGAVCVDYSTRVPNRVRVSVSDTGQGLSPDQLDQLFQPFNRLGQDTGPEEGTGIGLVVAKRLTELMGGAIGVESTVGKGSVFWVELDSAPAPVLATMAAAQLATPAEGMTRDSAGEAPAHTVLYVEDNPANLKLVEHLIARHADMRMLSAVTGQLGVALASSARPQVIVMDINLPDISGIEALGILRKNPATAAIPVVALSANAMTRDIEKGLKAGFFRYLTKPIKIDEFMHALAEAIASAEGQQ